MEIFSESAFPVCGCFFTQGVNEELDAASSRVVEIEEQLENMLMEIRREFKCPRIKFTHALNKAYQVCAPSSSREPVLTLPSLLLLRRCNDNIGRSRFPSRRCPEEVERPLDLSLFPRQKWVSTDVLRIADSLNNRHPLTMRPPPPTHTCMYIYICVSIHTQIHIHIHIHMHMHIHTCTCVLIYVTGCGTVHD